MPIACAPRRVLVTTPSTNRSGGVAQFLRSVRPHLSQDVQYFTVGARSDRKSTAGMFQVLTDFWRFARELTRGGHSIVHLNPSIAPTALLRDGLFLVIAKARGRVALVFVHGWDATCERAVTEHYSRLFGWIYNRADAFVVLGARFEKKLRVLRCDKPVFIQAAPVEDDLLDDSGRFTPRLRDAASPFHVLFLARVEPAKGIYEALEAHRILQREYSAISLTVAGDGSELERARQFVKAHHIEGVSFLGHIEGPAKYEAYRAADAYLFPSHFEGLPLTVLEAMAYGIPIVTSAVGSLPEFFENARMGFMHEGRDPQTLAGSLRQLIRDPGLCSSIRSFNRQYVRDHFTAFHIAAGLERLYSVVLEGAH